jgi:hypothetical protein
MRTVMEGDHYVGQRVICQTDDSFFAGVIVCIFMKRDRKSKRVVVENDDGILLIKREKDIKAVA